MVRPSVYPEGLVKIAISMQLVHRKQKLNFRMRVVMSSSCEKWKSRKKINIPKIPSTATRHRHHRSAAPHRHCHSLPLLVVSEARQLLVAVAAREGELGIRPHHRIHCHCVSQPPFPLPWSSSPLLLCLVSRSLLAVEEDELRSLPLLPLPTPPPPLPHLWICPD